MAWVINCSHTMMTSSNGIIFRVTGPLCGEFIGHRWIPLTMPVTRSFDDFYLRLNKRLSKQPRGWWFETPSWSLWRHCSQLLIHVLISKLTLGMSNYNQRKTMDAITYPYLNVKSTMVVTESARIHRRPRKYDIMDQNWTDNCPMLAADRTRVDQAVTYFSMLTELLYITPPPSIKYDIWYQLYMTIMKITYFFILWPY